MIFEIDENKFDRRAWECEYHRLGALPRHTFDEPMMYKIDSAGGQVTLTAFFGPHTAEMFDQSVIQKMGGVRIHKETELRFVVSEGERVNFLLNQYKLFQDLVLKLPAFCHIKYQVEMATTGEVEISITFQDFPSDSGRYYIKKRMSSLKASMVGG